MRAADPRLERRVTLDESALCLGELIERLSEQAGVPLSGPDDEPVSGEPVTAYVKDRPLADVLNGLYYLFGYRGGAWEWRRSADNVGKPAFSYAFRPTKAVAKFVAAVRAEAQAGFEREVEDQIAGLGRPKEELAKDPRPHMALFQEPDGDVGVAALAESLTPPQRRQLLRGGPSVTIPIESLGPAAQRFIAWTRQQEKDIARQIGTTPPPDREYTSLRVEVMRDPNVSSNGFSPPLLTTCVLAAGQGNATLANGFASARSAETASCGRMDALWPLPVDDLKRAAAPPIPDPLPLEPIDGNEPERDPGNQGRGRRDVLAFGKAAKVPVLARLTLRHFPPVGTGTRTPERYLFTLRATGDCGVAWRDGILLVTRHDWVWPRFSDPLTPWSAVKRMRAQITADPRRLLPVESLFFAAAHLTPLQIRSLIGAEQISTERMHGLTPLVTPLDAAAGLRDFLAPLERDARRRERLLGKGLSVASLPTASRAALGVLGALGAISRAISGRAGRRLGGDLRSDDPQAVVCLRVTDSSADQPAVRHLDLLLRPSAAAGEAEEILLASYQWSAAPDAVLPNPPGS